MKEINNVISSHLLSLSFKPSLACVLKYCCFKHCAFELVTVLKKFPQKEKALMQNTNLLDFQQNLVQLLICILNLEVEFNKN